MEALQSTLDTVSGVVWGPAMLVLLLGAGFYLMIGLKFMPLRRMGTAVALLFQGRKKSNKPGDITPFQSLMTALSATIGSGNIAGVATAIFLGGPGAVFWMWMTALVGMATKYAEAVLAVHYREVDSEGRHVGGPMYYIKNGLGKNWAWLGFAFAFFAMFAGFGAGNMVQSNTVAAVATANFGIENWMVGAALAVLTFAVIIGGVKRIASIAEYLVPTMAVLYIGGGLVILAMNIADVPGGLVYIVKSAFTPTAATGGFAGAAVWAGLRFGVARGVFSNEAGLGSAAIAHAASQTTNGVRQGMIAMLGVFIDTIIVCTTTALVIVTVHVPVEVDGVTQMLPAWASGLTGAELTSYAFNEGLPIPEIGKWIVTIGLILFAFTSILGWSYYGERAVEFLFGVKAILPFKLVWVILVFVGAVAQLHIVWTFADIANALMAIPNLIALIALSGTIFALTKASPAASKGDIHEDIALEGDPPHSAE